MHRRSLIAAAVIATAGAASARPSSAAPSEDDSTASINMVGVGLPVISGGRVRNYVFVVMRLHLAAGHRVDAVRPREPFLRDALVRLAHRTPLPVGDDWTRFDPAQLTAAVMRIAPVAAGRGVVTGAEVISQAPRRRTGIRGAR